jgi:tRNA(Ile)-lysidine synthase
MLMESALQAIRDHTMIAPGDRVLVAVSGGIDSIVLLDVLRHLVEEIPFEIVVGHVDHGLRGAESVADAAFVEALAVSHGLPVLIQRLDSSDFREARALGREGAARHARLSALTGMADRCGARRIALAHTANDRAETVLYHLTRGTGPTGLRGILPVRDRFIRPFIHSPRREIAAYADEAGLKWREDATNTDLTFARNRIRHRVLPELQAINPEVVGAVCRAADLTADLDRALAYLVEETADRLGACDAGPDDGIRWPREKVRRLPEDVARSLIREGLRRARGDLTGLSLEHIDAVHQLVRGARAHGELSLPGVRVRVERDTLAFVVSRADAPPPWDVLLELGENEVSPGVTLTLGVVPRSEVDLSTAANDPWIEVADADCVTLPLRLRSRRPGDRFRPLGLDQESKLKAFLINVRSPYFERDRIPLLCDEHKIIWVVGYRLSDTVKVTDRTERVLSMRMKGLR